MYLVGLHPDVPQNVLLLHVATLLAYSLASRPMFSLKWQTQCSVHSLCSEPVSDRRSRCRLGPKITGMGLVSVSGKAWMASVSVSSRTKS